MYTVLHVPRNIPKLVGGRAWSLTSSLRLCTKRLTSETHYDTLEVPIDATQTQIKSAYYRLTLKYHPDKNQTEFAKKKFQEISDAYEVLSTYESRQVYDRSILIKGQTPRASGATTIKPEDGTNVTKTAAEFDARSRQFYKDTFAQTQAARASFHELKKAVKVRSLDKRTNFELKRFVMLFVLPLLVAMVMLREPQYDIVKEFPPEGKR